MNVPEVITPSLLEHIQQTYRLQWNGLHGWDHWVRVWEIGQRLSALNGANQLVVALFAFTHDMARENDGSDQEHGPRAARRIRSEFQGTYFELAAPELDLLTEAVKNHTNGYIDADLTIQTCWDSDRLDLGRAWITPHPSKLCTLEAKDPAIIDWAYRRSVAWREASHP